MQLGIKECPDNMHKCLLGQCIDHRLVCDGNNDCGDGTDEANCSIRKLNITCGTADNPKFQCPSNLSLCLDMNMKCNGVANCPRGEDEADCGNICSITEFKCKSTNQCFRLEFRCDHEKDCDDGSDELNCDYNSTTKYQNIFHERNCDEANMFDCKDGQCVDMTSVCDGFNNCETGADEGPLCQTACKSRTGQPVCSHKCRATPLGAICSCFHGYKLDADKRTCIDINECIENDPCAQLCVNTHGSYQCSCYPDFMLRPNKISCKSIESESSLLFSTNNEVRSLKEHPTVLKIVLSANDSKIVGFDINVRRRVAYFTTDAEDVLYSINMTSGRVKSALSVPMPTKVAVDWITGMLQ